MNLIIALVCATVLLFSTTTSHAQSPDVLDGLRADHPRVLARQEDFARVRRMVAENALARQWHAQLKQQAEAMIREPVVTADRPDGIRMARLRDFNRRMLTLSLLHRLEPDPRYVERLWADLQAAADFADWNPECFLNVGMMAAHVAVAYDWLYDDWTEQQRHVIREALVRHALKPGVAAHERGEWWATTEINWNQVCNSGLIVAAVAIADHEPQLAATMIEHALAALPRTMARYAPDGGYEEGPSYWSYGTSYNVLGLAALESALGDDRGLGRLPGFDTTGSFPIQLTGPTNIWFNFADGSEGSLHSPVLLYLARRYDRPAYARFAVERAEGGPLDLLWLDPSLLERADQDLPRDAFYERVGVVAMRSAWDDPEATFVAAKAGHNGRGHGQLDLGSFVLEARGVRWVIDLGKDDYNLPGYFDMHGDGDAAKGQRWTYYRNRAEGHNTLVLTPTAEPDQPVKAYAQAKLESGVDKASVAIDLSRVYGGKTSRRITLDRGDERVTVADTIDRDQAAEVWWFLHTRATIELDDAGREATLMQDGRRLSVRLLEPAEARFTIMDARPLPTSPDPAGQNPNNGAELQNASRDGGYVPRGQLPIYGQPDPAHAIRKLAIHLPEVRQTSIVVTFTPIGVRTAHGE